MLKFHPLADLFPMMSDEEINALGEDMLENSQHEPIALFEGMILDGRNRYRACLLKGIEPRFREQRPADPAAFVASANLHRRHLEVGQRAIIAARLATMKRGDNQHSSAGETSQGEAAELLNVAKRSVERAAEVIKHGVPDLVDAVERGDVKVTPAAAFAEQNPPIEQQRKIIEAGSAVAAVEAASMLKRPESDIDAADRAASRRPQPKPDVSAAADHAEAQARRVSERRTITEGVMKTLDLFERDNIDPAKRAAAIIEQFDLGIAESDGPGKFSVARVRRAIEAMTIVFAAITADPTERRSA